MGIFSPGTGKYVVHSSSKQELLHQEEGSKEHTQVNLTHIQVEGKTEESSFFTKSFKAPEKEDNDDDNHAYDTSFIHSFIRKGLNAALLIVI